MKVMLASDAVEGKIKFPCLAQPKIDGVRAINMTGTLTGRSLKKHANQHVTELFSKDIYKGLDGEMAANGELHPDLCRLTSSALSTITGFPYVLWHLFDYVTEETRNLPYLERYERLVLFTRELGHEGSQLRVVPSYCCSSLSELLTWDNRWLELGYEGTIVRGPMGLHKEGRSTVREGGLLRIKRPIDAEAEVLEIIEGDTNTNEAQINELGLQFRTSHQEGKVPNGMVGAMICRLLADVVNNGAVLFKAGDVIKVSAGSMTHGDRQRYFHCPELLIGKIITFRTFPKGVKDKPRFPTFKSVRSLTDM